MTSQYTDGMLLLNFAHPFTDRQRVSLECLAQRPIEHELTRPVQFDHGCGFAEQAAKLIDELGLSSADWQTLPIVINPPSLNVIALLILAEMHGRIGHFPAVVRLRPVDVATPPQFEVAEIINLQAIRDAARAKR